MTNSDIHSIGLLEKELNVKLVEKKSSSDRPGYKIIADTVTGLYLNNLQLEVIPKSLSLFKNLTFLSLKGNVLQKIEFIEIMNYLQELDISNNSIRDLDFVVFTPSLRTLTFESNQVNSLAPVAILKNLKTIFLNNNLCSDLNPLSNLKELTKIFASNNELKNLEGLSGLINVEFLAVIGNKIDDISAITSLKNLNYASLGFNKIFDLTPIQNMPKLTQLSLLYNVISDLSTMKNLPVLANFEVSQNQITDISTLANFLALSSLDISSNPIESLEILQECKNLVSLKINSTNHILKNTLLFGKLTKLENLHLNNNDIEDVSFLSELYNLKSLELVGNKIKSVESLSKLTNLTALNLGTNKIKHFPKWLLDSGMQIINEGQLVNGYNLKLNEIEDVPGIFLKQNNDSIKDYLKSLEQGSKAINEIKVILLGEGAVGKTSIVNYLEGKKFNKNQSQTHGINIAQYGGTDGIRMKIWDFGGQDIMHHTHQLFLTENSVYVIVLNAREKSDVEKWLKLAKIFGGDSPVIIVTNKIDENPSEHENIKFLDTKYVNLKGRYARISCETGEGLAEFKELLNSTIQELLHVRTLWGNSWLYVKERLDSMRNNRSFKDYINYDLFREICDESGVNPNHQDTLINWLHELGTVTYFPDAALSETNVINPSWLTEAFYKIINDRIVADNYGRFSIADLPKILDVKKYPKQKFSFLLGLMSKFELCYQIDENTYLIPDLLKKEEPSFYFNPVNSIKFKFKYIGLLPKALLPKFMVRRHKEIRKNLNWRSGMVIEDEILNAQAVIRVDQEEKEISIQVYGEERRGYLSNILSTFNSINKLYEALEYDELVPCSCIECKKSDKPTFYKYSLLKKLKLKSKGSILCEKSCQDVLVSELFGIVIKPEELEHEISELIGTGSYLTKLHLENGAVDEFIETIKSLFSSVSYLLFEKSEKAYHLPLFLILRAVFGTKAISDDIQSKGRCDIVLNLEKFIYILELKLDGNSQGAIDQIYTNRYFEPYMLEKKKMKLIGINFSSTERNIESFVHEQFDDAKYKMENN